MATLRDIKGDLVEQRAANPDNPNLGDIFNPNATVVHVDTNVNNIAKNHRVDISFIAEPHVVIEGLLPLIRNLPDDWQSLAINRRNQIEQNSPVLNNTIDELYQVEDQDSLWEPLSFDDNKKKAKKAAVKKACFNTQNSQN